MERFVLAELAAKQEITEVLYRYCRAMDRMDRPLALACWHSDGTAEYAGLFDGTGAGFVDWVWPLHAGLDRHSHQVTNVLIAVDGDQARSEAYVTATLWTRPAAAVTEIVSRGRYLDRWARRNGIWAIQHRLYVTDLASQRRLDDDDRLDGGADRARRDDTDPSYALLPTAAPPTGAR